VLAAKPRAVKNALVVRKLPEIYQKLRIHLCGQAPEGYREYAKVLLLNREFRFEDVLRAIEESFKSGSPSFNDIRLYLITRAAQKNTDISKVNSIKTGSEIPVDSPSKFDHLLGGAIA
jgi:hypothetical protein